MTEYEQPEHRPSSGRMASAPMVRRMVAGDLFWQQFGNTIGNMTPMSLQYEKNKASP
jgi:hypothetical protein